MSHAELPQQNYDDDLINRLIRMGRDYHIKDDGRMAKEYYMIGLKLVEEHPMLYGWKSVLLVNLTYSHIYEYHKGKISFDDLKKSMSLAMLAGTELLTIDIREIVAVHINFVYHLLNLGKNREATIIAVELFRAAKDRGYTKEELNTLLFNITTLYYNNKDQLGVISLMAQLKQSGLYFDNQKDY